MWQDAQSAEILFAWIVQFTRAIRIFPFAHPVSRWCRQTETAPSAVAKWQNEPEFTRDVQEFRRESLDRAVGSSPERPTPWLIGCSNWPAPRCRNKRRFQLNSGSNGNCSRPRHTGEVPARSSAAAQGANGCSGKASAASSLIAPEAVPRCRRVDHDRRDLPHHGPGRWPSG